MRLVLSPGAHTEGIQIRGFFTRTGNTRTAAALSIWNGAGVLTRTSGSIVCKHARCRNPPLRTRLRRWRQTGLNFALRPSRSLNIERDSSAAYGNTRKPALFRLLAPVKSALYAGGGHLQNAADRHDAEWNSPDSRFGRTGPHSILTYLDAVSDAYSSRRQLHAHCTVGQ